MSQNIKDIKLAEKKLRTWTPEADCDLKAAIYDLLEENYFHLLNKEENNFNFTFKLADNKLTLVIFSIPQEISLRSITVNVKKLDTLIKKYIILCDSYYSAIKTAPIS